MPTNDDRPGAPRRPDDKRDPRARTGSNDQPARRPVQKGAVRPEAERIAKRLARAGLASRRDAEKMIEEGRVAVNGELLQSPAFNVGPADRIEVDGQAIPEIERTRLWLYNKPAGLVTTNRDPEGRPTVFENLPDGLPRVMAVGRLDINTEGLLLLTNDGGLARTLELPQTGWLRRYRVRALGDIDQERLDALKEGVAVDGVLYGSIEAVLDRRQGANVWMTVGLREGKNREVKNVLGSMGLAVNRLIRLGFGPFQLGDIKEGEVMEIRSAILRDHLGPRLAEESGADFSSPIRDDVPVPSDAATPAPETRNPGPRRKTDNSAPAKEAAWAPRPGRDAGPPRRRGRDAEPDDKDRPEKPKVKKRGDWIAAGDSPLRKSRKAKLEDNKEAGRNRLDTRPPEKARMRRVFDESGRPYYLPEDDPLPPRREPSSPGRQSRAKSLWRAPPKEGEAKTGRRDDKPQDEKGRGRKGSERARNWKTSGKK